MVTPPSEVPNDFWMKSGCQRKVEIDGTAVPMEKDTGAAASLITQKTRESCAIQGEPSHICILPTAVLGQTTVNVKYGDYCGT